MKKLAVLSAAALIGAGALTSTPSEARPRGGAIAAGVIGGLAAGALIGAAASSHAAPDYGYGYGYQPVHSYGYAGYRPVPAYGYRRAYYDEGYFPRHRYRRVVERRFIDEVEECRLIVKRRYNRFGELVVVRKQICD